MIQYIIAGAIGYGIAKIFKEDEAPKYADGGSVLLAPNGKPSNLTPEQYKLVRTPEFKKWFGDWENDPENASKVVDENGEPLVVYHGTNEEFTIFEENKIGLTDKGWYGYGYYFSPSPQISDLYGKSKSYFLNIKKIFNTNKENPFYLGEKEVTENYINKGYEGSSKTFDIDKMFHEYCVFFKFQNNIKLADGTNTTFDSNNNDIRYASGGDVVSDYKKNHIKQLLIEKFDYLSEDLYFIGGGLNGCAFVTEIERELYVVKYTNSITEFWLTQMAMVSNAPNIVTIKEVKQLSNDFEYGIIHKWVDRDGVPDEAVWNVAVGVKTKEFLEKQKIVPQKELEYVKELAKRYQNEIDDYFGFSVDVIQSNWGYEDDKLVLFDIDGNVKKSQYEEWMKKYGNPDIRYAGGGESLDKLKKELFLLKYKKKDAMYKDGGELSISKFYAVEQVGDWNDIPSTWKNTNEISRVKNLELDPLNDKFNSIFKTFLSTDSLRLAMMGYNVDEKGITCTNAHILATIPTDKDLEKGLFYNGKLIDEKYPNYEAVIPKDFVSTLNIDVYKLLQYSRVALNYCNPITFSCSFSTDIGVLKLNLNYLIDILETALKLDYETLYFSIQSVNRSVLISNVKKPILGKDVMFLIIPQLSDSETFLGTANIDYNLELSCYFDFYKNEIINKDGSIVDFRMNYGENPIFTKEIISLLKLNIDKKNRLPILDNFLIKDKIARVYNIINGITFIHKNIDAPTGLYYIKNNVAVYKNEDVSEYPKYAVFFDKNPKPVNAVTIDLSYFKWLIETLSVNIVKDDFKPTYSGFNMNYNGSELVLAYTNGHSLTFIKSIDENISIENNSNFNKTINFEKIQDLIKYNKSRNVVIEFYEENYFKIIFDNYEITSYVIDYKYPIYMPIVPRYTNKKLSINRYKLIDSLSSKEPQSFIKKILSSKSSNIRILGEENDGQLVVKIIQTESNYKNNSEELKDSKIIYTDDLIYDDELDIETTDSAMLLMPVGINGNHFFCFDYKYFNNFIKPVNTDYIDLCFNETNKAFLLNYDSFEYEQEKPSVIYKETIHSKKDLYAQIIEGYELSLEIESDENKIKLYNQIIEGYKIALELE